MYSTCNFFFSGITTACIFYSLGWKLNDCAPSVMIKPQHWYQREDTDRIPQVFLTPTQLRVRVKQNINILSELPKKMTQPKPQTTASCSSCLAGRQATHPVSKEDALLHHYRICEFGGFDCLKQPSLVDRVALRFNASLLDRVSDVCNKAFPRGGYCPPAPGLGSPW